MTDRPDLPGPLNRRGPRPLWLHLALAAHPPGSLTSGSWTSAHWSNVLRSLSAASPASPGMPPESQAAGWPMPAPDPALLAGIAAYRRHPYRRDLADPPEIWREGSSRLLDFGAGPAGRGGRPLLVIPSLVNRSYVLDLLPNHSMLRYLASQGVRPVLLDWGYPDSAERGFALSDYIAGRLLRAMEALGEPVDLAGYCMGGLMAVAAAGLRPALVRRLVLLASPWNFWAEDEAAARDLAALLPALEPAFSFGGTLPVDVLQTLFSLLDPGSVASKYRDFGAADQTSPRARMFVALEDWLNDGIPLAAPVARETLGGWYGANSPAAGQWRVLGLAVDPGALRMPCFVAAPGRDRIVPQASARALAEAIAGAVLHTPQAGHIGMVAGSAARVVLWEPLVAWLKG